VSPSSFFIPYQLLEFLLVQFSQSYSLQCSYCIMARRRDMRVCQSGETQVRDGDGGVSVVRLGVSRTSPPPRHLHSRQSRQLLCLILWVTADADNVCNLTSHHFLLIEIFEKIALWKTGGMPIHYLRKLYSCLQYAATSVYFALDA
jgi:hypothetical protein